VGGGVKVSKLRAYLVSWITKDAAQSDRVEGILRASLAATL
jgi:hypothetical protein